MDNLNNSSGFMTTYKDIDQKLEKLTEEYLKQMSDPKEFMRDQRKKNKDGLENRLVEIPDGSIEDRLRNEYTWKTGKNEVLGTVEPEEQVKSIKNIALTMLMSNRVSKAYKERLTKEKNLSEEDKAKYNKKIGEYLVEKDQATSDLLASLYVLGKSGNQEFVNYFCFGNKKDEIGRDALIVDVPYLGQMSVHFGKMKDIILEEAKNKATSILEKKMELGQINETEFKEYTSELGENDLLPEYDGELFEYKSSFPLQYTGETITDITKKLRIYKKDPEKIDNKDMGRMIKEGLNIREARYLCLKLGCPKKQLQDVVRVYNEREMIKGSIKSTNAEERQNVKKQEEIHLQEFREQKQNKFIGGR